VAEAAGKLVTVPPVPNEPIKRIGLETPVKAEVTKAVVAI